ncbi:MAG TPA: hypothetical protein PK847_01945 [Candidatus Sumerlaeota bacterium]|nr:hypothetical protein [Candidatus Sumerlaeota bacterium]
MPQTHWTHPLAGALLLAAGLTLAGCGTAAKQLHADYRALGEEFYTQQMAELDLLSDLLNELGREYFVLQQEYEALGRDQLAQGALRRAQAFHQRHQQLLEMKNGFARKLNQMRRGDLAAVPDAPAAAAPGPPPADPRRVRIVPGAAPGQGAAIQPPARAAQPAPAPPARPVPPSQPLPAPPQAQPSPQSQPAPPAPAPQPAPAQPAAPPAQPAVPVQPTAPPAQPAAPPPPGP